MQYLYAGLWLDENKKGGICTYKINDKTGELKKISITYEEISAGFLCISPSQKYLYVVDERKEWHDFILDKKNIGGRILAFKINDKDGTLEYINEIPSCGCNPNYICIDSEEKWLCAVNYGTDYGIDKLSIKSVCIDGNYKTEVIPDETNLVLISIGDNGELKKVTDIFPFKGEGSHYMELFQWCPHAHSVNFSGDGKSLIVTDRGSDLIYLFKIDKEKGKLILCKKCNSPKGLGPRNSLFHWKKKIVYIIGEVNPFISVYSYDIQKCELKEIQKLPTVDESEIPDFNRTPKSFEDFFNSPLPSDIILCPDKKHLIVTTRKTNIITIFSVMENGLLDNKKIFSSGGNWPRTCTTDKLGKFLYIGNQKDGEIVTFNFNDKPCSDVLQRCKAKNISCCRVAMFSCN